MGMLKRWIKQLWGRRIVAEDDDPDYRYHQRLKEFQDAVALYEAMTDSAFVTKAAGDYREKADTASS